MALADDQGIPNRHEMLSQPPDSDLMVYDLAVDGDHGVRGMPLPGQKMLSTEGQRDGSAARSRTLRPLLAMALSGRLVDLETTGTVSHQWGKALAIKAATSITCPPGHCLD